MNPIFLSDDDSINESVCEDEPPRKMAKPTSSNNGCPKQKTREEEKVLTNTYNKMKDLVSTAKGIFSETTPLRTFLFSLASRIEESHLTLENMCLLQSEFLSVVRNALKEENYVEEFIT